MQQGDIYKLATILLIFHLLIAVSLVIVILLQQSEGGGLGIGGSGSGSGSGLVSVRGTASLLTRVTAVLAAFFMLTSLTLAILATQKKVTPSVLDITNTKSKAPIEKPSKPVVPLSR